MCEKLLFLSFSFFFLGLSIGIATAAHPVFGAILLVLLFLFGSTFVMLLGLEYLSLTYVMVYAGGIIVLIIFVVMLLDIKIVRRYSFVSFIYHYLLHVFDKNDF